MFRTTLAHRPHRRAQRATTLAAAGALAAATLAAFAPSASAVNEVTVGGLSYDVNSALTGGLKNYQAAYSERNNVIWTTSTEGGNLGTGSVISKIDPNTLEVLETYPIEAGEAAYGIAVDDVHNTLWTTSTPGASVVVYDQATGERLKIIGGLGHPRDVAIDPVNNVAWVSAPKNGGVGLHEISLGSDPEDMTLKVSLTSEMLGLNLGSNFWPMALDIDADAATGVSKIYTVNFKDGKLIEITKPKTGAPQVRAIETAAVVASGVAIDAELGRAYVSDQGNSSLPGKLYTVDLASGTVIGETQGSGGGLNVAVDPDGGVVYTALFGANQVLLTDATTGACIGEIPVGANPNDVIFADGSAWAVDRDSRDAASRLWQITPTGGQAQTDAANCGNNPDLGSTASVVVDGDPSIGGTITLRGTGWKTQDSANGSTVAIKFDDGSYVRLDKTVMAEDEAVWTIVEADEDGTFTLDLTLPDGSTTAPNGTLPAFTAGKHSLLFLTGSLKDGDVARAYRKDITVTGTGPSTGNGAGNGAGNGTGTTKATASLSAPKKVKLSKTHKLKVKVASSTAVAGGVVKVKVEKKGFKTTQAKVKGTQATVKLPKKLKPGTYKVTITFTGTDGVAPVTTTVKLKVKR